MLMNIFNDPNIVKNLISKITELVSQMQNRMIDAGATVMWMADPTSSEDLIHPDMFRRFSLGYIKKVIYDVKTHNDIPTFLHICGNTIDIINDISNVGVDCLSFDHNVDPTIAKRKAGKKLSLMGNIDPVKQIMMGTPESVTESCYRLIDIIGQDGGFILAPGCETPINSPDANVIAMGIAGSQYWKTH